MVMTMSRFPENTGLLKGRRVLIVEDDMLVSMLMEEYVSELGCVVVASVRKVSQALEVVSKAEFDIAVLDYSLGNENTSSVADALEQKKIPFIFASGYGENGIDSRWADHTVLQKPFTAIDLQQALLTSLQK